MFRRRDLDVDVGEATLQGSTERGCPASCGNRSSASRQPRSDVCREAAPSPRASRIADDIAPCELNGLDRNCSTVSARWVRTLPASACSRGHRRRGRRRERRLPPCRAGSDRRRPRRPRRADQRVDVPQRRAGRAAARRSDADPDEHVLRRALSATAGDRAAARLGRVRRHPARVIAAADGGDPPAGQLGDGVRPGPSRDLGGRGGRAVPPDGSDWCRRGGVPAVGRLRRPLAAVPLARRPGQAGGCAGASTHPGDRHRRRSWTGDARAHRPGHDRL